MREASMIPPGSTLDSNFKLSCENIRKQISRIKERLQARALGKTQPEIWGELGGEKVQSESNLPCDNLPWPADSNFCGRELVLSKIREKLAPSAEAGQMRSWVLHGGPGLGKTQTALMYAHSCLKTGYDAVFWIKSETLISIEESFTEVALRLGLRGAEANGDRQYNRYLVIKWLQSTKSTWLLVLDNIENLEFLGACWPSGATGAVLVTSRESRLRYDVAIGGDELPPFEPSEGAEYLMKMIGKEKYSDDERRAALDFSRLLGGLPLALSLVGSKIRSLQKPIAKYTVQFQKNPSALHQKSRFQPMNLFNQKTFDVIWQEVFGPLASQDGQEASEDALNVMGLISFLSGDDISRDLFNLAQGAAESEALAFVADEDRLDDAFILLIHRSIVRAEASKFAVHRLTQDGYLAWVAPDKRYDFFLHAVRLLHSVFPKQEKGMGLRTQWQAANLAVAHVLMLCRKFLQYDLKEREAGDMKLFTSLLKSCGWFLMERHSWSEFLDLLATADRVCSDKESLDWAHICNTAGSIEYERGHAATSKPWMLRSLEIRQRLLPADDLELSDMFNNFGNVLLGESQSPESLQAALEYFIRAKDIDERVPHGNLVVHIRYQNMGSVLTFQGRFDEASHYFELTRQAAIANFGPDTHFVARADYCQGRNHYRQRQWRRARKFYALALDVFVAENPTNSAVAAVKLKLGNIAMFEKDYGEAQTLLRAAELICAQNESAKGDKGDTARVKRRLAELERLKGNAEAAEELRREAETIRQAVQGQSFAELPDTEESYDMMVFHAFR